MPGSVQGPDPKKGGNPSALPNEAPKAPEKLTQKIIVPMNGKGEFVATGTQKQFVGSLFNFAVTDAKGQKTVLTCEDKADGRTGCVEVGTPGKAEEMGLAQLKKGADVNTLVQNLYLNNDVEVGHTPSKASRDKIVDGDGKEIAKITKNTEEGVNILEMNGMRYVANKDWIITQDPQKMKKQGS